MIRTPYLRWVIRDGAPVLQCWSRACGWEHPDYIATGGQWEDVPFSEETDTAPDYEADDEAGSAA